MSLFTERITPQIADEILKDARTQEINALKVEGIARDLVDRAISSGDPWKVQAAIGIHSLAIKAWTNTVITQGILEETLK